MAVASGFPDVVLTPADIPRADLFERARRASGYCNSASCLKERCREGTLVVAADQALAKGAKRKDATMGTCARSCPGHYQPMKGSVMILGMDCMAVATHKARVTVIIAITRERRRRLS